MKHKTIGPAAIVLVLFGYIMLCGCNKENTSAPYIDYGKLEFKGNGAAAQMVPAGTSSGTANFYGVYDATSQIFNYKIGWENLTSKVTAVNFYGPAAAGQTGLQTRNVATYASTAYRLPTDSITGAIWMYNRLTDNELSDMKKGYWYYVITTLNNTGGEVRGQLTLVK